jgi:hypothetical protein
MADHHARELKNAKKCFAELAAESDLYYKTFCNGN